MQSSGSQHIPPPFTSGYPSSQFGGLPTGQQPSYGLTSSSIPSNFPAAIGPLAHSQLMPDYPLPSHVHPYAAFQSMIRVLQDSGQSGAFQNAHDFVMNQPQISSTHIQNLNIFDRGIPVLERLYRASIQGTEIDAKVRYPPPRCHPGTRVSITKEISGWMTKPEYAKGHRDLLWLYGYAGVGKTAVAQTIGEFAKDASTPLLGAAFFFSRTRKQNDPSRVFISIAYQLATVNKEFRRLVNEQLMEDVALLEKDMRTQFRKLLVEPLSMVKAERKLLVIVDGLDECAGYDEQCQIIELIGEAAKPPSSLPVIWMICSRPESYIKKKFFNPDFKIDCWRKELPVDSSEARRDIETFFRAQFKEIREKYHVDAKEDGSWPTANDVEKVVSAASGLFIYASTAAKFIGDPNIADPDSQLKVLIEFIDCSPARSAMASPMHYLDKLYEQILSEVQFGQAQLALKIMGAASLYTSLSALQLANLFGVSQGQFYTALFRLHSVVIVPPPENASRDSVSFFHASFNDFLRDPKRSGKFAVNPEQIHAEFAKACFNALNQTKLRYAKNLAWPPRAGDAPAFSVAHQILVHAADNVWSACMNLGDVGDPGLFDVIVNFRYPFLRFIEDKIPVQKFSSFVQWLIKQIHIHKIENIVQAVKWKDEYLEETFGPTAIDKVDNSSSSSNSLSSFTLGLGKNCVTVLLSSDFIILSCED